jgi:NADH-quinone oxidoreductase subunit G
MSLLLILEKKPMIEIEINGQKVEVAPGSMIIEAADNIGVKIPRFCYHKKLSIAANCRMCLVEVEKAPKPLPACATPVTAGMKVFTQSEKALDAQQSVMEFLLINHPLDCPICDQGGSCELQDLSMGYGKDYSRYEPPKRSVKDEDLGPLIATDMTRCIQCTRCVRFGYEVVGVRELGTISRGDRMEIGSYLKSHVIQSELSGNIIDLCPVGALTSKPFRFTARAWELIQGESIASHDGVGSNIYLQTLRGKVMRVVPKENEKINEIWISDRDRFSYQGLYSEDRLTVPIIKQNNEWVETDWTTALEFTVKQLKSIKDNYGANEIAALASPNSTLEEFYLLQKFMRGIGSNHIDHRLHELDSQDQSHAPLYPSLGVEISALQDQEVILIIGSHIHHEHPLIAHRIRKAYLQGAKILCVNPIDFEFAFGCEDKKIIAPHKMPEILSDENLFAEYFNNVSKKIILLGALALNHPEASRIRYHAEVLSEKHGATLGYLYEGANNAGAWIAGCIPHRGAVGETITPSGYSVNQALFSKLRGYILLNIEPDLDFANSMIAMQGLKNAECVIALSAYRSKALLESASVILPIGPFAETSGTYVNVEGRFQSVKAITPSLGESRPAWKVLRVLGNFFQLQHFDYANSEQICSELKHLFENKTQKNIHQYLEPKSSSISYKLQRITEWPLYRADALVRRSHSLQLQYSPNYIKLNPHTALRYQLLENNLAVVEQEGNKIKLPVKIDSSIPDDCVWVPAGFEETSLLGNPFGEIKLSASHD